jgi:hypothetical protein
MLAHLKTAASKQQFITQNALFCSSIVFPSPLSLSQLQRNTEDGSKDRNNATSKAVRGYFFHSLVSIPLCLVCMCVCVCAMEKRKISWPNRKTKKKSNSLITIHTNQQNININSFYGIFLGTSFHPSAQILVRVRHLENHWTDFQLATREDLHMLLCTSLAYLT